MVRNTEKSFLRYLNDPRMQQRKTIKCVMRFLKRTKAYMLTYRKSGGLEIVRPDCIKEKSKDK
ncbi:hypothetical protein CR513_34236, partial [Mucuna pruriens]